MGKVVVDGARYDVVIRDHIATIVVLLSLEDYQHVNVVPLSSANEGVTVQR